VCKRWRHLSCGVKGLRVLFQGHQQQQVDSFCAWLRRYAGQVKVLAITSPQSAVVLAALAEVAEIAAAAAAAGQDATAAAAAAALGGGAPSLQRLVVTAGALLRPFVYECTLRPLLGALPGLQHLHLHLTDPPDLPDETSSSLASMTVGLLSRPLQQCTSLTSLVLDGPTRRGNVPVDAAAQAQLASGLPTSLRSLTWNLEVEGPVQLSFGHLTALTHLHLKGDNMVILQDLVEDVASTLLDNAFTGLHQLRQLVLHQAPISDEGLLVCKEHLVALAPAHTTHVLAQLTRLQSLRVDMGVSVQELLVEAPQLQELHVQLDGGEDPPEVAWATPWVLQQYSGLTGLQRLSLSVADTQTAPLGLCALTQLKQLAIIDEEPGRKPETCAAWAMAVAGLVNLEVLSVPAALTASWHPWLTGLTRLVVLEVCSGDHTPAEVASAASHIGRLLAADVSNSGTSSSTAGLSRQMERVRMVCFNVITSVQPAVQLHRAVAAAVPVLPRNKHLFRGSWQQLQECGVELWPEPVAARLQQLQLV
jgi:hypothetical protein